MQTVEHLEGTMTDSEEGHSSEVNLFSPFINLGTEWETSAIFVIFLNGNTKEPRTLCHHKARVIIGNLIVDPISTDKYSFRPTKFVVVVVVVNN